MHLLVIGGTRYVGLAMVQEALARGHRVDLFHRGQHMPQGVLGVRHLIGERSADLQALSHGSWDAVIDTCAYRPHEVQRLAQALQGRTPHYALVSTVSVYAQDIGWHANETAARAPLASNQDPQSVPIDGNTYGALKALCEDQAVQRFAKTLIVRPSYVLGPHDYSMRFPTWVQRLAAGGEVLAPGPKHAPMQYIDARDLAAFVIHALEQGTQGVFNVAAPRGAYTFEDWLLELHQAISPPHTALHWLSVEDARASAMPFPLWSEGTAANALAVDASAAYAHGLVCRPLAQTARDVQHWLGQSPLACTN